MENKIRIIFCTGEEPLEFNTQTCYTVESIVIESCKYLNIGPISRHLFALWCPSDGVWLPSNKKIDLLNNQNWLLHLKIRFKLPSVKRLFEKTDAKTSNYYFHQVRTDFIEGKIPELLDKDIKVKEKAFGLVAADIIRLMLEEKSTPNSMKYNARDFSPPNLMRNKFLNKFFDRFLHKNLHEAVSVGWKNSRQNPDFVKEKYLQQLFELVPDYGAENYSILVEEGGKIYEVSLAVNPFHPEYPGLRMKVEKSKNPWTHICSIQELCSISMRNDNTVQINRQNGIPRYLKFHGKPQMHSFVSLLDGYYRLSEKWTFNLCKDLETPSLLLLNSMKCHGPVGKTYACHKLEEKSNDEIGCYLLRESEIKYNEYFMDILLYPNAQGIEKILTVKIYKDEDGLFCIKEGLNGFSSISQLITHLSKEIHVGLLKCIPPSEYDKTVLLLCRKENKDGSSIIVRGDCSCVAQCIPRDALIFSNKNDAFGSMSIVSCAELRRSHTEYQPVAVKMLLKKTKITYFQEFLSQCDKVLFWQHDAIINTIGIVLSDPVSLVMEWYPLGSLDNYLLSHHENLRHVDLVEATFHIATALWYLEELETVHGKIRCRNVLVSSHTDNSFKVKLADPGIIAYTDADIHWIPPEHYNDYLQAAKSSASDVYAFGTTVWEIFTYGMKPSSIFSAKEAKEWYQNGNSLPFPPECHKDIKKLILECWIIDPDNRKQPQAIVRDANQILYEVYNSRRSHSYAVIGSSATCSVQEEIKVRPSVISRTKPQKESTFNRFKSAVYNFLSLPSDQSVSTTVTDTSGDSAIMPVNGLDSISESETDYFYDPLNVSSNDLSWLINYEELTFKDKLGQGFYGEVVRATLTHCSGLTSEEVAVKRIKMSGQPHECFADLKREIEIMKNLRHNNIVEIKGLVEEPEIMLVMEYLELGSLLAYLQLHKNRLSCSQLLKFAIDVAEGMAYLEQKHIVHRDLAARNVLVASEDHVKISDFGLAQFTGGKYYWMRTQRNLPIRWYALESISNGKFSHQSDVWSFGVTLWEMFSYGKDPQIPDVPDTRLTDALLEGRRLGMNELSECPAAVYSLMLSCWEKDSHDRPTFKEIIEILHNLLVELCP